MYKKALTYAMAAGIALLPLKGLANNVPASRLNQTNQTIDNRLQDDERILLASAKEYGGSSANNKSAEKKGGTFSFIYDNWTGRIVTGVIVIAGTYFVYKYVKDKKDEKKSEDSSGDDDGGDDDESTENGDDKNYAQFFGVSF